MNFTKTQILNDVVLDFDNPFKIFKLAKEYDRLEQGAAAWSFYLRAADMAEGKIYEENWIQYKSVILGSHIFHRSKNRDHSTEGLLKMAIETMPERPEAYYFMAKFKEERNDWREAMMYSKMGLSNATNVVNVDAPDNDLNYPGHHALELLYARAKWKTDGRDSSKNLAFDLKYKNKLNKEIDKEVTALLIQHGYPSTLAYQWEDHDRYKFKFEGSESIDTNYSRHFQDMFVLSVLNGKKDGTFVELGSGHPELFNNTLLLENKFGWKGISIDNDERMCHIYSRKRQSNVILDDAGTIDYKSLFARHCFERKIDFLRINAEKASIDALKNMPFDNYEFDVIQFQHNAVWWGNDFRKESREILAKLGYILLVSDVAVDPSSPYEDWWVHPRVAHQKKEMKSKSGITFAWDYMMEKL